MTLEEEIRKMTPYLDEEDQRQMEEEEQQRMDQEEQPSTGSGALGSVSGGTAVAPASCSAIGAMSSESSSGKGAAATASSPAAGVLSATPDTGEATGGTASRQAAGAGKVVSSATPELGGPGAAGSNGGAQSGSPAAGQMDPTAPMDVEPAAHGPGIAAIVLLPPAQDPYERESVEAQRELSAQLGRMEWDNSLNSGPPKTLSTPLHIALFNKAATSKKDKKKIEKMYGAEALKPPPVRDLRVPDGSLRFSNNKEGPPPPLATLREEPPAPVEQRTQPPLLVQFRPAGSPPPFRPGPTRKGPPNAEGAYFPDGYERDEELAAARQRQKRGRKAGRLPDFAQDAKFKHLESSEDEDGPAAGRDRSSSTASQRGKQQRVNQATPRPPSQGRQVNQATTSRAPAPKKKNAKPATAPVRASTSGNRGGQQSAPSLRRARERERRVAPRLVDGWRDDRGGRCRGRLRQVLAVPWDGRVDVRAGVCHRCREEKHPTSQCLQPQDGELCESCGRRGVTVACCPRCAEAYEREQEVSRERLLAQADNSRSLRELRQAALSTMPQRARSAFERLGSPPRMPPPPTTRIPRTLRTTSVATTKVDLTAITSAAPTTATTTTAAARTTTTAVTKTSATITAGPAAASVTATAVARTTMVDACVQTERCIIRGPECTPPKRPSTIIMDENGRRWCKYEDDDMLHPITRGSAKKTRQRLRKEAAEAAAAAAAATSANQPQVTASSAALPVPDVLEEILEMARRLVAMPEDQRHLVIDGVQKSAPQPDREASK